MKLTTKLIKEMVEAEIAAMDEGRLSDIATKIGKWANPGKYEDPGSDEFVEKRFDEAYQLLAAARSIISQFDKQIAGKLMDVEHEVLNMRDAHRPAAAEGDVVEENEEEPTDPYKDRPGIKPKPKARPYGDRAMSATIRRSQELARNRAEKLRKGPWIDRVLARMGLEEAIAEEKRK